MDVLKLGVEPAVLFLVGKGDEILSTQLYSYIRIRGLAIRIPIKTTRIQWTSKIDFFYVAHLMAYCRSTQIPKEVIRSFWNVC